MIEINKLIPEKIDEEFFKKIAEGVLKEENKKGDISVVFVCQRRMRELNKKYRKKDKATDVLSFNYKDKETALGEVVICPEIVKKNAKKFNLDYNKELAKVLIHGILHISGYDHEKSLGRSQTGEADEEAGKMEKREEYYLSKI